MDNKDGAKPFGIDIPLDSAPLLHSAANRLYDRIGDKSLNPMVEEFFARMADKFSDSRAWSIEVCPDFAFGYEGVWEMLTSLKKFNDHEPRLYDTLGIALETLAEAETGDALQNLENIWQNEDCQHLLIETARIFFLIMAIQIREDEQSSARTMVS